MRALLRGASRAMHKWLATLHREGARTLRSTQGGHAGKPSGKRKPASRGGAVAAPGEHAGEYRNAFGTRRYGLFVPSSYRGAPLPLVVMLHGCKQDPDDFARGTRMNALAEEFGCLVVYPGQARSANAYHCWNWFEPGHQQRDAGEPALIAGIVRKVMRGYAVDPRFVYAAGMSAGGSMAVVLAAAYPELIRAIGVHSGLPYGCAHNANAAYAAMKRGAAARPALAAPKPVPVIVFHGDDDDVVHPANGRRIVEQLLPARAQRMPPEREQVLLSNGRTCRVTQHRALNGQPLAEHWRVAGAGHAWCGGSALGRYTDPLGPDASREMLRFFYLQGAATTEAALVACTSEA